MSVAGTVKQGLGIADWRLPNANWLLKCDQANPILDLDQNATGERRLREAQLQANWQSAISAPVLDVRGFRAYTVTNYER